MAGWSLGATVAIATAAAFSEQVRALIALSSWTTLAEVARELFPAFVVDAILSERYDSLAAAPAVRVPALVVHGERDEMIPVRQGRRIAEALAGPTRWVPVAAAGHNDLLGRGVVWDEIKRFLGGLKGERP
jgi:pimeloyl-ACP methyl ester carboxylesterase